MSNRGGDPLLSLLSSINDSLQDIAQTLGRAFREDSPNEVSLAQVARGLKDIREQIEKTDGSLSHSIGAVCDAIEAK